jgi:hypothetical protein
MIMFFKKVQALSDINTFVKPWKVFLVTFLALVLIAIIPHPLQTEVVFMDNSPVVESPQIELGEKANELENLEKRIIPMLQEASSNVDVVYFAMGVAGFCLGISFLILLISFPVYFWSANEARAIKAGKLVKSSFGFIIASGGGVLGTLSFAA